MTVKRVSNTNIANFVWPDSRLESEGAFFICPNRPDLLKRQIQGNPVGWWPQSHSPGVRVGTGVRGCGGAAVESDANDS